MEKLPQEIEVWYIIPELRRKFAIGLRKKGLKQNEVAQTMGLTSAAVSQYISSKRAGKVNFCDNVNQEIRTSINMISTSKKGVNEEIQRLLSLIRQDLHLCKCHKELDSSIKVDCKICFSDKK